MASAVRLREDYSAEELRALARRSKTVNQSRRLLSLAVRSAMAWTEARAAKIGGMDRQTLHDWVHRFNGSGLEGLVDNWTEGPKPRLSAEQLAQFAQIVEAGPDREKDGVVRWRRLDLKRVIAERFGVDFHPRYVGKLLHKVGFPYERRPRHPAQDERIVEAFKNVWSAPSARGLSRLATDPVCFNVSGLEGLSFRPRWRYARSGPHKTPGVERRFLNQASEAPFDCQAIPSSPSRKSLLAVRRFVSDRRTLRRRRQSCRGKPLFAPQNGPGDPRQLVGEGDDRNVAVGAT